MTGWHFDSQDTPQQRAQLRRSRSAQSTRRMFPADTRVTTGRADGTVRRHIPGGNSQGGYLIVTWDNNGITGRINPVAVSVIEP
jgi:hypothetical protein